MNPSDPPEYGDVHARERGPHTHPGHARPRFMGPPAFQTGMANSAQRGETRGRHLFPLSGWGLVQVRRGQRGRAELVVDAVERGVESTGAAVGIEEWQLPTLREKPLR